MEATIVAEQHGRNASLSTFDDKSLLDAYAGLKEEVQKDGKNICINCKHPKAYHCGICGSCKECGADNPCTYEGDELPSISTAVFALVEYELKNRGYKLIEGIWRRDK